jgi:hypothetical protein
MALVSNDSDQVPSPNHATSEFSSHALNPASTVLKSSIDSSLSAEEGPATPNVTSSLPLISIATPTIANESSYETSPEVVSLYLLLFYSGGRVKRDREIGRRS